MSILDVGVTKKLKQKISISIDSEIWDEFNKIAKAKKYNKSRTITNLINVFIENEKRETAEAQK